MYDLSIRNRFIELRAKGWSLARIAGELQVAQRTLVEWNRQEKESIQELRACELEAMQEKILATHEQELRLLKHHLDIVEFRIFEDTHEHQSLFKLYKMASLIRSEIRKVCDHSSRHLRPLEGDPSPSLWELSEPTHRPPIAINHPRSTINHLPKLHYFCVRIASGKNSYSPT